MPTDEQLDRIVAAAVALRDLLHALAGYGLGLEDRTNAGHLITVQAEYDAALEDARAAE